MSDTLSIGEKVTDFSAPATSDLDFKLSNYKGKSNLFGVSKDSMKRHDNFKAKQSFPFELISDVDSGVCEHFNVWQLKKMYGKEYMGIVRSTFLIDKEGVLREQWGKVKVKGHAAEVLEAVKAL